MIREEIKNLIKKAIQGLQEEKIFPVFAIPEVKVEHPEDKSRGDYATNIAMQIAKLVKKSPLEVAEEIKNQAFPLRGISRRETSFKFQDGLEKVEIAPPGFINFWLSKEYLQKQVGEILKKGEKFGELNLGKGKKTQVEFISANPTGPLTVGNSRGGFFGDILANVLKKAGFKTEKEYYVNDCGNQILTLGHSVLKDKEAQYKGDYIDELHQRIKEKYPYKAGEKAAKIIIEEMIKKTTDKMGIEYDDWFSEKWLHQKGLVDKAIAFLKKKKFVYEKEGALWFKSTQFNDERDRVLVKKDGDKTYLAGDIAYHRYKFEKKKFDKVINIWGADHYGDVPGLQAGVAALGHKGKLDIVLLQFVTLFQKGEKLKMSKRRGTFVTMDELLAEVPLDVVRFFFIQKSADTHLNFDLELAKTQNEKNPVYYVQYANARICSILKKLTTKNPAPYRNKVSGTGLKLLNHSTELALIKQLLQFPEIVEDTARDYQVQRLPQYATELATTFHQFYRDCQVINPAKELQKARLSLLLATKTVLKNTLDLMGISAPEKM